MQTIALNPSPQLRTMANTVFGYTGNKFEVAARESVIINSHWGGGSRDYFALVDMESQAIQRYGESGAFCQPDSFTVTLTPSTIVLEHTIFCGKDMGITFYVHPSQFPKYLPAGSSSLTWQEKVVLTAVRTLKSSYGGIPNFRRHEAKQTTGITEAEYEETKSDLISQGLLNKAGAITPNGRNALTMAMGNDLPGLDQLRRD